jgi:hypothetical protein
MQARNTRLATPPRPAPRGAAALLVVMALFFIVALVAGYASRNLIFEQRTSAHQLRATQAFEAAEAGLEWALAMLHSGRIDAVCAPHIDPATADDSFRQRYLDISVDTGRVGVRSRSSGQPLRPACVFDGTQWQCSCPVDGDASLIEPVGPGPFPAFVVRFFDDPAYPPGVVRIEAIGCTRLDEAEVCGNAPGAGDGRARVSVLAALKSALVTPPAAAVTVRGPLDLGAAMLQAVSRDPDSGGYTLHVGGALSGTPLALHGLPGTPPDQTIFDEPDHGPLATLSAPRMFASVFGMDRDTYRLQPAAVVLPCAGACTATVVRDTVRLNPGRVLWIAGDLTIDDAGPIGTDALPALLVVTGSIQVTHPGARLHGVVYSAGPAWASTGTLALHGALIAEGALTFSGAGVTTVEYDAAVLERLRRTHGSFVRIPGSWRDF